MIAESSAPAAEPVAPQPPPVEAPRPKRWPAVLAHVAALASFTGLTIFHTWPVANQLRTHLVGGTNDTLMNAWHLWWMRQALWVSPHNPFSTPLLHYPMGAELYWHTLCFAKTAWGAVLLAFITPETGYNLIFLATFVLTGYTSWLLLRYLLLKAGMHPALAWAGAFAGACAFDFSRYHQCQAFAHLNLNSMEGMPLYLFFFFRYLDDGKRKDLVGVGLAALYVALSEYYYLAYVATFSALWLVGERWTAGGLFSRETLRDVRVRRAMKAAGAAVLACSPVMAMLLVHAFPSPVDTMHGDSDFYVDLAGLFRPDRFSAHFPAMSEELRKLVLHLPGNTEENGYYLGTVTPLVALAGLGLGLPNGKRWLMLGLFYLALSLSVYVSVDAKTDLDAAWLVGFLALPVVLSTDWRRPSARRDLALFLILCTVFVAYVPVTVNGGKFAVKVPGPYLLFKSVVPFFSRGGMPNRLESMTTLSIAVMVAFAAAHLGRIAGQRRWLGAGLALAVAAIPNWEYRSLPYPMIPVGGPNPVLDRVAAEPPEVAVFTDGNIIAQYEQIRHHHKISFGLLSRVPVRELEGMKNHVWEVLQDNVHASAPVSPVDAEAQRQYLVEHRFKYYVTHWLNPARDRYVMEVLRGQRIYADGRGTEWFLFPYVN